MDPSPNAEADLQSSYSNASAGNQVPKSGTPAEATVHCFELADGNGHVWLKLVCKSRAQSPEHMPRIVEGDKVTGYVEINLKKPMSVKAVRVSVSPSCSARRPMTHGIQVTGELVGKVNVIFPFLYVSQDLWVDDSQPSRSSLSPWSKVGKLRGAHSWPFALELPRTVTEEHEGVQYEYRPPASFTTRVSKCTIVYKLTATVVHGKFTPKHQYAG